MFHTLSNKRDTTLGITTMADIMEIHEAAQALEMFWSLKKKGAITLANFREYKELLDSKMLSKSSPPRGKVSTLR